MQSVSSRIWTRVAVSTSYDDNHYTTGINKLFLLRMINWSYNCLQRIIIIIISYLKSYHYLQIISII